MLPVEQTVTCCRRARCPFAHKGIGRQQRHGQLALLSSATRALEESKGCTRFDPAPSRRLTPLRIHPLPPECRARPPCCCSDSGPQVEPAQRHRGRHEGVVARDRGAAGRGEGPARSAVVVLR